MELDVSFYRDFITNDPTTGSPIDADALPTCAVFENNNDTPIYAPVAVKRTDLDGHYRVNIVTSAANGFEEGGSYIVVISATVSGTAAKAIIHQFIIDDMSKSQIAATITPIEIPSDFEPDMTLFPEPDVVASMDETFGYGSDYANQLEFVKYYDQIGKVWTTDDLLVVTEETRDEVAAHQALVDGYDSNKAHWDHIYKIEREVQWRTKVAVHLRDYAAANES